MFKFEIQSINQNIMNKIPRRKTVQFAKISFTQAINNCG